METKKYTKEEALKAAKKSLVRKKEVIRWMKSGEPWMKEALVFFDYIHFLTPIRISFILVGVGEILFSNI